MRRLWNLRRNEENAADWPEPRPEFLTPLAARVRAAAGETGIGRVRLAFAGVLALALLVAASALGGVGYAARQAEQAVEAVTGPLSGPSSSDSSQSSVSPGVYDSDNAGYAGKCKNLKQKLKRLNRKHLRQWRALLADQRRERANFRGRRGSPAWHRLLASQQRERQALKRKQRAERRKLQQAIKKCEKGRR